MIIAVAVLLAYTVLSLAWLLWPVDGGYRPQHLVGSNPYVDEIQRALSGKRRELSRRLAPWSQPPIRHQTEETL